MCFDNGELLSLAAVSPKSAHTLAEPLAIDANRRRSHAAAVPSSILQLISGTLGLLPVEELAEGEDQARAISLSLDELKFLRAATGALLNMSLKYGAYASRDLR